MSKLIISSNRLPVTATIVDGQIMLNSSAGGLATGLAPLMDGETIWVGWSGLTTDETPSGLTEELTLGLRSRNLVPVEFTAAELTGYYTAFANGILWPLYHYQTERMPLTLVGWEQYVAVNTRFAHAIAEQYRDGDLVWIHDYHLQLVPRLLRELLPDAKIGFFLHIPFPSSEIFRILPWRSEILEGLLGADVVGFHTHAYARYFRTALLRILGIESYADNIDYSGRTIKAGAFPLGVDSRQVASIQALPVGADLEESLVGMRTSGRLEHLLLAIDRLDYTKGIPRRLLALERLLEKVPEIRGKVALLQIAVPSRDDVPAYGNYRRQVEELVGRINGKFGQPGYQPIQYVTRTYTQQQIFTLYRHIDVMVVTPLRDGMNLVAKEFIACRQDGDGVLVLSEFAGAAAELGEAVHVNPYDIDGTAEAIKTAIFMIPSERKARMKALRMRIAQFDAATWTKSFIDVLCRSQEGLERRKFITARELLASLPTRRGLALLLDYDGTLFPIVRIPQLAAPDKALLALLDLLARNSMHEIHIISGRPADTLAEWLGHLPVHLHAEHGAMSRSPLQKEWVTAVAHSAEPDWKNFVWPVLNDIVKNTPGSFVEEKTHALAWHYRMADPDHAERTANELRLHGREAFSPLGLELISGKRVIEVRIVGINKGAVATRIMKNQNGSHFPVAIGDDTTDEDMFSAVSDFGVSVVVGDRPSRAQARLRDPAEVRKFLQLLLTPSEKPN